MYAHRRGVVQGVVIGAAVANARRPATVVVPAPYVAPAYYGQPAVYYPPSRASTTEVIINTTAPASSYPPQSVPYYPPGSQPQPYPQPNVSVSSTAYPNPGYPSAAQPTSYPQPMASPPASVNTSTYQDPPYNPAYPQPMAPPPASVNTSAYQDPAYNPAYSQSYNPPPYATPTASVHAAVAMENLPSPPMTAAAVVAGAEVAAASKALERRYFLIVNEANCSVLEVERGVIKPNTTVVADKRRQDRPTYQVWYMDDGGVIRSKLNDFAMESKEHSEKLKMMPYTGDARQKWVFVGNRIVNDVFRNDCLGLKKGLIRLKEDADVVTGPYEGKPYQHWRIEHI